jgi:hypothetical protein
MFFFEKYILALLELGEEASDLRTGEILAKVRRDQ